MPSNVQNIQNNSQLNSQQCLSEGSDDGPCAVLSSLYIYYYCFVQLSAGLGRNESCDSNIRETIVKECKTLTFVKLNNDLIDLQMFIIFSSSNLNLYRNLSTLSIWSRKHFSLTIRPRNTMHCA